jgi:hypothetical protein
VVSAQVIDDLWESIQSKTVSLASGNDFVSSEKFALSNLDVVHSEILVPRKMFIV